MRKIFCALVLILAFMSGSAWAAYYNDPYHIDPDSLDVRYLNDVYSHYGSSDVGFFYELRDVTGASRREPVAGPQWFATVYENYYHTILYSNTTDNTRRVYRRTMGGEIPEIPFSTAADIVNNFNYIFAEEPEPYNNWISRNYINPLYYDIYPDPVESFCIVTTDGRAEFNVKFGNAYARHFPFWYGWQTNSNLRWWQNYKYDSINEPIHWVIERRATNTNSADIYVRTGTGSNTQYLKNYTLSLSGDKYAEISDTSGNLVYTISNDNVYNSSNTLVYTISGDTKIYDANGQIAYTLEDSSSTSIKYLCNIRRVYENVEFNFGSDYNVSINPSQETLTNPGEYHTARVNISDNSGAYGSKLGYLTFRQRANLADGYSNFREAITIPVVIANVSNGNASNNPLIFDMIIYSQSNDIVGRQKFTWDAQQNKTQDLGTFYTMTPYNSSPVNYKIETRITNRTGTRYLLYPYTNFGGNNNFIVPSKWEYDLTPDVYGTLPNAFMLDAHSQIAPGLVTVYSNDFPLTLGTDTSASYRLYEYEYNNANPKDLTLKYKRISGMIPQSTTRNSINLQDGSAGLLGFYMQFVDIIQNDDETNYELINLMGLPPVMVPADQSAVTPQETYIGSSAITPFKISKSTNDLARVSHDIVPDYDNLTEDGLPTSKDVYTPREIAIQPVSIRFKISRQNSLLASRWESLNSATTSSQLFNQFANFATVWVRSAATKEQDANLFTAINNKGANVAAITANDCVNAFILDDYLYLDFIVLIADATSRNTNKTAFIEVFRDDGVPYILIGDGNVDGKWELEFYVAANAENPETRISDDVTPVNPTNPENNSAGSSGGGGCNSGIIIFALFMPLLIAARKR